MVICKFFLQGTCKFGDFCKFDHQLNDNFNKYQTQNSTSILRQSQFSNTQPQPMPVATNPSNVDTNTLVKSVVNDMTGAEKGGQWLLSCYAPFKEKPAFPGFEDQSAEEIRLGYYEAVKNGTVEQYKQQVQIMLHQTIMRMRTLQAPSPDIVNLLKSMYNTPPSSYSGVYGSNTATSAFSNAASVSGGFGQQTSVVRQPTSPMFPQSNQSIFGNVPQTQNQFGGTALSILAGGATQNQAFKVQASSIFGNTLTQSQGNSNMYGQGNSIFAAQGSVSLFGVQPNPLQAATGSIFGGQRTSGTIFGAQATNTSIFGGQQAISPTFVSQPQVQQNTGNIFVNSFTPQNTNTAIVQSMFGSPPNAQVNPTYGAATPPIMQNMPQQTATNIFAMGAGQLQVQPAQNPIFLQQQPQASVFNQQSVGTVFNQPTNTAFSQPSTVVDAKSHTTSIFGNIQNSAVSNSPFAQQVQQQVDETVYSKLEELTEDEIKWFESDDLDILKIPEKPPTYQMCFKT